MRDPNASYQLPAFTTSVSMRIRTRVGIYSPNICILPTNRHHPLCRLCSPPKNPHTFILCRPLFSFLYSSWSISFLVQLSSLTMAFFFRMRYWLGTLVWYLLHTRICRGLSFLVCIFFYHCSICNISVITSPLIIHNIHGRCPPSSVYLLSIASHCIYLHSYSHRIHVAFTFIPNLGFSFLST